jgi:molybdenum cofactor biosynthesis enzyme MoaA
MKRASTALDILRLSGGGLTGHERKLRSALREFIRRSDDMISAIDLSTNQLATETARLSEATSAAEKALRLRE